MFINVYCIYTCITLCLLVYVVYMFSTLSACCKLMSASQSSGFWLLHSRSRHMSVYFNPFKIHTHDGNLHPLEHLQDINSKTDSGAGELDNLLAMHALPGSPCMVVVGKIQLRHLFVSQVINLWRHRLCCI